MKKRILIDILFMLAVVSLTPVQVWNMVIRPFPSAGYEYFCLSMLLLAWLVPVLLVALGMQRQWFRWRMTPWFLCGFLCAWTLQMVKDRNHHFTTAVLSGNLVTAELLLHAGADINAVDSHTSQTPLQRVLTIRLTPEAADWFAPHRKELAEWLISRGAGPETT